MFRDRLTALDSSFLEVETPTGHMHVGWAAAFAPADGRRPSFDELRDHVASRLARAPRYRQKLAEVPLGVADPVWVDDADFDPSRHIRRAPSGDLNAIADEVMSRPLERSRPLWELWIADRLDDGRVGVVGKVHHCMVDGVAAVELAALLLDPTPEPPPAGADGWRADARPGGLRLLVEGALDRAADAVRVGRWTAGLARHPQRTAELLGTGARVLRAARRSLPPAPDTPLNEPISQRRHNAWARRSLEDLRRVRRRHSATVNDVVLAAVTGGLRRFLIRAGTEPMPLKAMVPVNVRADGAAAELGNRISFAFARLPCDEPDPVVRLRRIQEQMAELKQGGEPAGAGALMDAVEYAPRTLQQAISRMAASPRMFNLVVSNIPGPQQPLYMLGCRLDEAYPVVPLSDRHALSAGMTTVGGQACFGVYVDPAVLPDADGLAAAIVESVDELQERAPLPEPVPV